jgi:hypothetical protein
MGGLASATISAVSLFVLQSLSRRLFGVSG